MKYLPLVLAALRRKPVRSAATFLSVIVAFTLFGLMIGLNATFAMMVDRAHADRIWTVGRFAGAGMPFSVANKIARLPGIKKVSVMSYVNGYVGDPKNLAGIIFFDNEYGNIFPDQVPPVQAALIRSDPTAIIMNRAAADMLHKKVGDRFSVTANKPARADGTVLWPVKLVGIYENIPQFPGYMISGNYGYFDKSRPLADQGKIDEVDSLLSDPARGPALAEQIDTLFANSGMPTRSQTEKQSSASGFGGGIDVAGAARKIALLGLLMIFLLTANVIAQSVRERTAEFATLKSFGFRSLTLCSLVIAEAAIPCLTGALLGVTLAGWLAPKVPTLLPTGYGIPLPMMTWPVFLWAELSALLLVVASTVGPILRLSRMDLATALAKRA